LCDIIHFSHSEIVEVITELREHVSNSGKVTLEQLDRLGGVKMSAGVWKKQLCEACDHGCVPRDEILHTGLCTVCV
jgi:hypothetical protein